MSTPPPDWIYYLGGILLLLGNLSAWVGTLFMMPGNWVIVALAALSAYYLPEQSESGLGFGWTFVAILGGMAILGEFLEFFGGAAKAKQYGASKRSMVLSVLLGMLGAALGGVVGSAFPLVGSIALLLVGAAGGAFLGTYLGEAWKGRPGHERWAISRAALFGRLYGTAGKLIVGMAMVCLCAMASFYF